MCEQVSPLLLVRRSKPQKQHFQSRNCSTHYLRTPVMAVLTKCRFIFFVVPKKNRLKMAQVISAERAQNPKITQNHARAEKCGCWMVNFGSVTICWTIFGVTLWFPWWMDYLFLCWLHPRRTACLFRLAVLHEIALDVIIAKLIKFQESFTCRKSFLILFGCKS